MSSRSPYCARVPIALLKHVPTSFRAPVHVIRLSVSVQFTNRDALKFCWVMLTLTAVRRDNEFVMGSHSLSPWESGWRLLSDSRVYYCLSVCVRDMTRDFRLYGIHGGGQPPPK